MSEKEKTPESKVHSSLSKDINRIKDKLDKERKMNMLRKHQIKLYDKFLKKLINEGRISKNELEDYMPKKKEAKNKLFEKKKNK